MPNTFTNGKRAIAECDRCGFRFKLNQLRTLVIKTKNVNLKVCEACWEPDHPQLQLGMYPVADPQALFDPRPDRVEYAQMRASIQPVYSYLSGSERTFATGAVGTVGIDTPVDVAVSGVPSTFYLGTATVVIPPAFLFLDTFTGPAGPLSGHTADTGQSWSNALGYTDGTTAIQLNGTGDAALNPLATSITGVGVALNMLGSLRTMTVDIILPASPPNGYGVGFGFRANEYPSSGSGANYVGVGIYWNIGGSGTWSYSIFTGRGGLGLGNTGFIPFATSSGTKSFTLQVDTVANTKILSQNNTQIGSLTGVNIDLTGSLIYVQPQTSGALSLASANVSGPNVDPYYSNVVLLLHMDGTNGSTTFIDNSPTPKTVSPFGNTAVSTSVYKYGTGSAYFDGAFDGMVSTSTDFRFGTGDFTIEFWLYIQNLGSAQQKAITANASSGSGSWGFYLDFDKKLSFRIGGITSTTITTSFSAVAGTWYHLAATRTGTVIKFFVNGGVIDPFTTYNNNTNFNSISDIIVGSNTLLNTNAIDGYIDEYRVTKDVSRYYATFTPPQNPFQNQ